MLASDVFGFFFSLWPVEVVGGPKVMNAYLRAHCERFKFRTVDADEWRAFFEDYVVRVHGVDKKALAAVDWDGWFERPGMPPTPKFDESLSLAASAAAQALAAPDAAADSAEKAVATVQGFFAAQVRYSVHLGGSVSASTPLLLHYSLTVFALLSCVRAHVRAEGQLSRQAAGAPKGRNRQGDRRRACLCNQGITTTLGASSSASMSKQVKRQNFAFSHEF